MLMQKIPVVSLKTSFLGSFVTIQNNSFQSSYSIKWRMTKSKVANKLTILVASVNAVGHVNACAGALSAALTRGHRLVFVVENAFRGRLTPLGYEEFLYCSNKTDSNKRNEQDQELGQRPGEQMAQVLVEHGILGDWSPLEKMTNMARWMESGANRAHYATLNGAIELAIAQLQPDLIYVDGFFFPAVHYSNIPWVCSISVTPLFGNELILADHATLPPSGSGLPSCDSTQWKEWDGVRALHFDGDRLNCVITELGYPPIQDLTRHTINTQAMTVYAYPDELNYDRIRHQTDWFNLEVFNGPDSVTDRIPLSCLVPDSFLTDTLGGRFSGKLIYLSLGSMGAIDVALMCRLVAVLATTRHKYIVSKGPRHKEYELPDNMWGDRYLPQVSVVRHCDLVITHGGNNTVTEVFALGKPMLVLPLLGDQFDNAQRLTETGLGARLDPYAFADHELVQTVDRLLADCQLHRRLSTAARRITACQASKHTQLAIALEKLVGH